jgi:hypothetical protein
MRRSANLGAAAGRRVRRGYRLAVRVGHTPETIPAGGLPNARKCTGPVAKGRRLDHRAAAEADSNL